MREEVQKKCDMLMESREHISKTSFFQNEMVSNVAAYVYADKGKDADEKRLKECMGMIKKKQGIFSDFRGDTELIVASNMDLSDDPEKYLDDAIRVYNLFQKGRLIGSSFRVLAALYICDAGKVDEAEAIVAKTEEIIKAMSKKHPFMTSDDDVCFAVLLALAGRNTDVIFEEVESSYRILKKKFYDNAAYALAIIMATYEGGSEEKCNKVFALFEEFAAQKMKYGKDFEITALGTMIKIPVRTEELVRDVIDTAEYLKGKKGFKMLDISRENRLMFAAMIVSSLYADEGIDKNNSMLSGSIAIVITQQIIMSIIIMSSMSAAAAAASSH